MSMMRDMAIDNSDRELVTTRVFDAPRSRVFDAFTRPKHLPRWMCGPEGWTMPVCRIDLRPGGAWHFEWRRADGSGMTMRGSYRVVQPPDRLVSTERWGGDWPETLNTLALVEDAGKTTATLTVRWPSRLAREAALNTGMTDGMSAAFVRLDAYLRTMA